MADLKDAAMTFMGKPERLALPRAHAQGRYEGFLAGAAWQREQDIIIARKKGRLAGVADSTKRACDSIAYDIHAQDSKQEGGANDGS